MLFSIQLLSSWVNDLTTRRNKLTPLSTFNFTVDIHVRDRTQFSNKKHILHFTIWFLFNLQRRKMGLISIIIYTHIMKLDTFIVFIHGKRYIIDYLSHGVCGRCTDRQVCLVHLQTDNLHLFLRKQSDN
jgi:hypothetical protein